MSFTRPTLDALVTRIQADLTTRLGLTAPVLRRSVVNILARVIAGAVHMLHGALEWVSKQIFPGTADDYYLLRWGNLYGMTKTAATFSQGKVTFTGTNGTLIPAGTVLVRTDSVTYQTLSDWLIAGGVATIDVSADVSGANSNCDAGTVLAMESPIAGVDDTATSSAGISGGTDEETSAAFAARLGARIQNPPHGGNAEDYAAWALEVAGVTRAWVYPLELGAGTVVVRFVRDNDVTRIPDAGEVATVQAALDAKRPVTAAVTVLAPTELTVDYTIALTIEPDAVLADVKAAIEAELEDLHAALAPSETLHRTAMIAAIKNAAGVHDFTLTVPASDSVPATGEIPTFGTITWS